jgi:hypothetical protein
MTAVSCLRILLPSDETFADLDVLAGLVAKIGGAFLEGRWQWPRRWGVIAPFAFGLADPRALRLDPLEMQLLSAELQRKLFGDRSIGEVCLMTLEGSQEDVMRFAVADAQILQAMLRKGGAALNGHLLSITPTQIVELVTLDSRPAFPHATPALPAEAPVAPLQQTADHGFRGVYHIARELFIGSVVTARPNARTPLWSVVDGLRDMPMNTTEHDMACLAVAREAAARPGGVIFVPINFSAVVHSSVRRLYEPMIAQLPISQRHRLAAAVYDTPRDPSWSAMSQLKTFLGPRFGLIDMQITDPAFAADKLPEDAGVTSVTFALPEGDEKLRLMAAKRFMSSAAVFHRRRVWPALSNLRTRRELAACVALKAPFVTGKAVTATLRTPPDATPRPFATLPLHGEEPAPRMAERSAA